MCSVSVIIGPARTRLGYGSIPKKYKAAIDGIVDVLRPGPWMHLPVTPTELGLFLKAHAISGVRWPDNHLTIEENRRLFASKEADEVARLVTGGLTRRFRSA